MSQLTLLLVLLTAASAQDTGEILGQVLSECDRGLARARVQVSSEVLPGGFLEIQADRRGRYHFEELPPGTYRVSADKKGFAPVWLHGIDVRPADHAHVDVGLTREVRGPRRKCRRRTPPAQGAA